MSRRNDNQRKYVKDFGESERRRRVSASNMAGNFKPSVAQDGKQRRKSVGVNAMDARSKKEQRQQKEMSEEELGKVWDDVRKCRYLRGYEPLEMRMPSGEVDLFDSKDKHMEKIDEDKGKPTQ